METRRRKLIRSSSSISEVGDDEDLLVEILIRLPGPKSAFRCKSVCKRWNSLISTPYFPRRFVAHRQTLSASAAAATDESEPPVLTLSKARELILSFVPFPGELRSKFSVLDCNKDLLLLGFWGRENDKELRRTYLVCNPFTKQWVVLPLPQKSSGRTSKRNRWIVKLVPEPYDSQGEGEGEGFPCRFRVVKMYNPARLDTSKVDVYVFCSRSGEWKKSVLRLDEGLRCQRWNRVVSKGGQLYWLNRGLEVVKWGTNGGTLPTVIDGSMFHNENYGLWVSEGAVHLVCMEDRLGVWKLDEENGGGWRKRHEHILLKNLRCNIGKIRDDHAVTLELKFQSVIGMHPTKSEIVFLWGYGTFYQPSAILSWDFKKKQLEFVTCQDDGPVQQYEEMFQPRVIFWPSQITSRAELPNPYNGSYNCWLPPKRGSSTS